MREPEAGHPRREAGDRNREQPGVSGRLQENHTEHQEIGAGNQAAAGKGEGDEDRHRELPAKDEEGGHQTLNIWPDTNPFNCFIAKPRWAAHWPSRQPLERYPSRPSSNTLGANIRSLKHPPTTFKYFGPSWSRRRQPRYVGWQMPRPEGRRSVMLGISRYIWYPSRTGRVNNSDWKLIYVEQLW